MQLHKQGQALKILKTNKKYGNHGRKKQNSTNFKHVATAHNHKFTNKNLTDEAIMFIHSGLVNQTMHCIVQINPFCPSFAAKTLIIPLQKQTSRQIHRHVFLARKETDLC